VIIFRFGETGNIDVGPGRACGRPIITFKKKYFVKCNWCIKPLKGESLLSFWIFVRSLDIWLWKKFRPLWNRSTPLRWLPFYPRREGDKSKVGKSRRRYAREREVVVRAMLGILWRRSILLGFGQGDLEGWRRIFGSSRRHYFRARVLLSSRYGLGERKRERGTSSSRLFSSSHPDSHYRKMRERVLSRK